MAAGATYEPIATQTLASTATSITFSSIAATYTDLRLVIVGKAASGLGGNGIIRFNGSTTGYSQTNIKGDGASAISSSAASAGLNIVSGGSVSDAQPQMFTFDVFSYAGSTYKTTLMTGSADLNGSGNVISAVGLWQTTSAITQIVFLGSTMDIGTTATLYGIKAA
jgi:hypothetical protein